MKTLLAIVALSCVLSSTHAQTKSVFIKWSPASLAVGKITVGSEYNFKKKQSFEFIVGVPVSVSKSFDYDNNTSEFDSKAFSLFAGYRYYFGKRSAAGLYIEPYVKYLQHDAAGFLQGDLDGETARFDTKTSYKGFGAGAQLGVQFLIAKKISLDFFFLGPEANTVKFSSISTDVADSLPWTFIQENEAEQNVKEALEDIPLIGDKIQVTANRDTKSVSTKYDGFLPGFRFGASVGIRL